jgi:transposase-like protein
MGTITTELVETGEKRDARGRRMTPVERRAQLVRSYQASGLTMAAFARRERINYATFAGWVLKSQKAAVAKAPIRFAQMRLPLSPPSPLDTAASEQLEVRLPDGTVLRGGRVADVAALVRTLRA